MNPLNENQMEPQNVMKKLILENNEAIHLNELKENHFAIRGLGELGKTLENIEEKETVK